MHKTKNKHAHSRCVGWIIFFHLYPNMQIIIVYSENGQTLLKKWRIIYFYTIHHLHFKRESIYEINDNLPAKHGRISEKGMQKG